METIRQLREETQYIPPTTRRRARASNTRTVDPQVTLCHLAQNMVERESVPTTPPETFTFTKPTTKRHRRHSSNRSLVSSSSRPQRPNPNSPATRHPSPPRIDRHLYRPVEASPNKDDDIANNEDPPSPRACPPGEPPTVMSQSSTSSVTTSTSASTSASASASGSNLASGPARDSDIELNTELEPPESPKPTPRRERVKRTKETTQDGTDLHNTMVVGWIPSKSGDQMVEAYIDRRLKINLISRRLREQLDLAMKQHTGEVVGQYDGKAYRSLGTATLHCGNNRVSCHVIDELERPLIFGRMFLLLLEEP